MGPVIVALSSWYFAAQVLVAWVFRPQYSFVSNVISGDLVSNQDFDYIGDGQPVGPGPAGVK